MEAKELRIGNYVHNEVQNLDFQVDGSLIATESMRQKAIKDYQGFKPIPLTEEWLLKFGASIEAKTEHANFYKIILNEKEDTWILILSDLSYWIGYGSDMDNESIGLGKLKYIHQLQNLYFALTGEELSC
jgi:hypothetical protein